MYLKKVWILYAIFFSTLLFSACIENNNGIKWWNADVERISTISYDSTLVYNTAGIPLASLPLNQPIGQSHLLKFKESILIFVEKESSPFIKIFDQKKKEFVASFGSLGRGPGEFHSISSSTISCHYPADRNLKEEYSNCYLFLYDIILQRLTKINIQSLLTKAKPEFSIINTKSEDGFIFGLVPILQDSTFVANGIFRSSRLQFIDSAGNSLSMTGSIPTDGSNSPLQILSQAYISDIFYNQANNKIFLINHNTDKIEIYNEDGTQKLLISGPGFYEPQYDISTNRSTPIMGSAGDMRFSNVDLCFDQKYFYVLYSGLSRAQAHSDSRNSRTGNKILKFNYKGELQEATILPFFASAMGCNSKNNKISLLVNNLSPELYLISKERFK